MGVGAVTICLGSMSEAFNRCLLVPNLAAGRYIPAGISLGAPLIGRGINRGPTVRLGVPFISTVVRSISNPGLTVRLTHGKKLSFVFNSRPVSDRTRVIQGMGGFGTNFMVDSSGLAPRGALTSMVTLMRHARRSAVNIASSNAPGNGLLNVIADHSCHTRGSSPSGGIGRFVAPFSGLVINRLNVALDRTGRVV